MQRSHGTPILDATILDAIYQKLQELLQNKNAELQALSVENHKSRILIKWPFNTLYIDDTTICHTEQTYITINHPKVYQTRYDWADPQLIEKLEATINTIPDKCKTKK